jgi:hypothetical protein
MSAPTLQYVALLAFFILGAIVQVLVSCYYKVKSKELENQVVKVKERGPMNIIFGLFLSGLAMYCSYSLADWARSNLSYAILAVHWIGVIYSNYRSFEKEVTIKGYQIYLSLTYVLSMVAMLILYGVQCL